MTPRLRLLGACAALLVAATGLLLFLNHAKFASTFEGRLRDRQAIVADKLAETMEARIALGVPVSDTPALRELLQRGRQHDPAIRAIALLDPNGATTLVVGAGDPALWRAVLARPAKPAQPAYGHQGDVAAVGFGLLNAFNVSAGALVLEYSLGEAQAQTRTAFSDLWPLGLAGLGGALLLLALIGPRLVAADRSDTARDARRLSWLVAALLLAVQGLFAWNVYQNFNRVAAQTAPLLGAALTQTVNPALQRALEHRIPLAELRGMEDWLSAALTAGPEFHALRLRDAEGKILFQSQVPPAAATAPAASLVEYTYPVRRGDGLVGEWVVSLDLAALSERTRQLAIELVTLALIGFLLCQEVLKAISSPPTGQQGADLARLRLPLFLFFVASELPRSFLPVWAGELARQPLPAFLRGGIVDTWAQPLAAMPETLLSTVPISAFLLAVAVASAFAGPYCARQGPRRLLLAGIAIAVSSQVAALFADSLLMLFLSRVLAGVGFACASLAALDYIGRQSGAKALGMALYLSVYVAAGICGAGLGALVVDRAGIAQVFLVALACSGLAALAMVRLPQVALRPYLGKPLAGALGLLLRKPAFTALLLLVALPMQMIQQGLLFYWTPLALAALGERTSFVGLAMMGYFLMVLLLNGAAAQVADRTGGHRPLMLAALALAALCAVVAGVLYSPLAILAGVAVIGVAWALGFPSLGATSLLISQHEPAGVDPAVTLGLYRTIERIGAMLAPVVVAALIVGVGHAQAAWMLGLVLLGCAAVYGLISRRKPS